MSPKQLTLYIALCETINLLFLSLAAYGLLYHPGDKQAAVGLGLPFWFIAGALLYLSALKVS